MSKGYQIAQAFFKTQSSGNWSDTAIWKYRDYNGIFHNAVRVPSINDTVYIEQGHTVTLNANASCKNLNYFKDSITKVNTGVFTLSIYGVLRRYIGIAPGTYSPGANGSTQWLVGNFSLAGTSRTQSLSEYAAARNLYGYTVSIDLDPGHTLTLNDPSLNNQAINLGGTLNINTGTLLVSSCTLRVSDTDPQVAINNGIINVNSGATLRISSQVASFQQINRSNSTSIANLNINDGAILQLDNSTMLRYVILQYGTNANVVINGNVTLDDEIPASGSGVSIPKDLIINAGFDYNLNAQIINIRGTKQGGGTFSNGTLNENQP